MGPLTHTATTRIHLRHKYMRIPKVTRFNPTILAVLLASAAAVVHPLELDVPYVESPPDIVKLMLDMSDVSLGDYVIDLGTGDGRIVIAAARLGATGHGIDLDPKRVEEARENARESGMADRVAFLEQDLFESELGDATVVTMFLNEEVNLRVRPRLLEQLSPGTRIVSHNFDMGDWQPDGHEQVLQNNNGNFFIHDVYFWVVPADMAGIWQTDGTGQKFRLDVTQKFQALEVKLHLDGRPLTVTAAWLRGDRFTILAAEPGGGKTHTLSGRVTGDTLRGLRHVPTGVIESWTATRS